MLITKYNVENLKFGSPWWFSSKKNEAKTDDEEKRKMLIRQVTDISNNVPDRDVYVQGKTRTQTEITTPDGRKGHVDSETNVNKGDNSIEVSTIIDIDDK